MYSSVEISISDKASKESLNCCLGRNSFFHAGALFDIKFNYRGKANGIVISLEVPSLPFSINYSWWRKPMAAAVLFVFFSTTGVRLGT